MQREIDEANWEVRLLAREDDIIRIQVGQDATLASIESKNSETTQRSIMYPRCHLRRQNLQFYFVTEIVHQQRFVSQAPLPVPCHASSPVHVPQAKWRAYAARKEFRRRLHHLKQKCGLWRRICLLVLFYFTQPTAHAGSSNAVAASPSEGAVRVLQAAVRGWLQRQAYLWELEFFKENEASVVVLQTAYRGMACGARTKKSTFVVSLTAMFVLLRFSSIKPRRAAPPTPLIFCSLQGEAGLPNATRIPQ